VKIELWDNLKGMFSRKKESAKPGEVKPADTKG
jgi:hypothetical protein